MLPDKPKDKKMLQLPSLQNILQLGFLSQWQRHKNPLYVPFQRLFSFYVCSTAISKNLGISAPPKTPCHSLKAVWKLGPRESPAESSNASCFLWMKTIIRMTFCVNCESLDWALDYSYIKGNQMPGPIVDPVRSCTLPMRVLQFRVPTAFWKLLFWRTVCTLIFALSFIILNYLGAW